MFWASGCEDEAADVQSRDRSGTCPEIDEFLSQLSGLENGTRLLITTRALPEVLDGARVAIIPIDKDGRP